MNNFGQHMMTFSQRGFMFHSIRCAEQTTQASPTTHTCLNRRKMKIVPANLQPLPLPNEAAEKTLPNMTLEETVLFVPKFIRKVKN